MENLPISLSEQLYVAIDKNDSHKVNSLINQGVDVNKWEESNLTPLMLASARGQTEIVEILLNNGADIFSVDSSLGASALHKAAQSGVVDVAQLLLNRGAFINLQSAATGHTPLIDAVWCKHIGMAKFLLDRGASVLILGHHQQSVFDFLGDQSVWTAGFSIPSNESWGKEILDMCNAKKLRDEQLISSQKLMQATINNDIEAVKHLISQGFDVNEISPIIGSGNDGQTPLLVACFLNHAEIVKLLLLAGAKESINDYLMAATPAHKACYAGQPEALRTLLEFAPNIDLTAQGPYNGYTALHDSCWHGHMENVKILLAHGVPLDQKSHQGLIPSEFARALGYIEIAELIESKLTTNQP
jgi:ankyrin repeat protein